MKRNFLYKPYGNDGNAVLLYFHKKPVNPGNSDDEYDMTGVDVPTKECPVWSFWRSVKDANSESYEIHHDLSQAEITEIKNYIRNHKDLVPNMSE
jgi:hypothetical protein